MNVGKYDLNETSILKFDPKVQEVALSTHDLQVYYGNKHAFLMATFNLSAIRSQL